MIAQHHPGLAKRAFDDDMGASLPLGIFDVVTDENTGQRWFWFKCPGKCGAIAPVALRPVQAQGITQSWDFDGNMVAPTLGPSVNHVGCWHGWLRGGVWSLA